MQKKIYFRTPQGKLGSEPVVPGYVLSGGFKRISLKVYRGRRS